MAGPDQVNAISEGRQRKGAALFSGDAFGGFWSRFSGGEAAEIARAGPDGAASGQSGALKGGGRCGFSRLQRADGDYRKAGDPMDAVFADVRRRRGVIPGAAAPESGCTQTFAAAALENQRQRQGGGA